MDSRTKDSRACSKLARLTGLALLGLLAAGSWACSSTSGAAAPGSAATGGGGRGGRGGRGGGGAAQPVVTARVGQRDVPVEISAVGNVEAYTTISVKSQVSGQLQQAFFHEGDVVKKGDRLFLIDPRPLEATLRQAQATLTRDEALLNQAEAQLARDKANAQYQQIAADRQAQLFARGLISKDAGEQAKAAGEATAGLIKSDEASVESAKAQLEMQRSVVDNARVQLSYSDIRSPINGRTGSNTVKPGNLVGGNSTELVTITQLQPVYVTFAVPAVHLVTVKEHSGKDPMLVMAASPVAGGQPIEGRLTFVDNAVDQASDTIKLKATFPNDDLRLWPGQFTRVTLRLTTLKDATVVPSQAVQTGQEGQFVFVVKQDSTVDVRPVTVAQRIGETVVIGKGLTPGERIVTEGQLRLEQGTRIQSTDSAGRATGGGGRGGRGRGGRSGGTRDGGRGTGDQTGQPQGGARQGGQGRQGGQ